jgi:hypothetical protein
MANGLSITTGCPFKTQGVQEFVNGRRVAELMAINGKVTV